MQMLPELSEYLADELACGIGSVAEPYRNRLVALLKVQSRSDLVNLKDDLAAWFARMKPSTMVRQYTQIRRLVLEAERFFGEETPA
jgi:hypothetical protein